MEFDVLDTLEQLGYSGALLEEKPLLEAAGGGLDSPEFGALCRWIVSRIKELMEPQMELHVPPQGDKTPADTGDSVSVEVRHLLEELNCPHKLELSRIVDGDALSAEQNLKLLLFLSSELQAAQISTSRRLSDQRRQRSPVWDDLQAVCRTLEIKQHEEPNAAEILTEIQNKVQSELQRLPAFSVGNPVLSKSLSSEQWESVRSINAALCSEYECRRRMLIKRLDVTVQSFGWSDRAKVKVDAMASVYQPKRRSLRPRSSVGVAELLAAREEICNVVKTSSGASREKTVCAVNKVLMGRVPDRGGRPSEIQAPPPEMPPWQKRQDGGSGWGRGGGGGAWRGGGGAWRGGGGGGGWGGGHGQHGGKRGRYQY